LVWAHVQAMLADGVPALANVEGASTRELHAALTALSGQREELMNATKKWIREGMDRFVGMGHSKLALPEETLAALAHLPTVEGLRAMGADQKKALVARFVELCLAHPSALKLPFPSQCLLRCRSIAPAVLVFAHPCGCGRGDAVVVQPG
jgi:hypothetical protein